MMNPFARRLESGPPRRGVRPWRIVLRWSLVALLAVAAVPGAFLTRSLWGSNLGVIEPGRAYRSAQPTTRLREMIAEHRLASILNLRGGTFKDDWYAAEVKAAEENGLAFLDLHLSATRRPSRRELLQLIDTLGACEYPLLIHCKAGADRTGLASVIYLMTERQEPPRQALRGFTLYHGHVPVWGTEHLHEPIEEYADWLDAHALSHSPQRFRDWVRDEYQSADPRVDPPPLPSGPRHGRNRGDSVSARDVSTAYSPAAP